MSARHPFLALVEVVAAKVESDLIDAQLSAVANIVDDCLRVANQPSFPLPWISTSAPHNRSPVA